jgi:hypothetical protein
MAEIRLFLGVFMACALIIFRRSVFFLGFALALGLFAPMHPALADVILSPHQNVEAWFDLDTQFPGNPVDNLTPTVNFGPGGCPQGAAMRLQFFNSTGDPLSGAGVTANAFGSDLANQGVEVLTPYWTTVASKGYLLLSHASAPTDVSGVFFLPVYNFTPYRDQNGGFIELEATMLTVIPVPEAPLWAMLLAGFVALGLAGSRTLPGGAGRPSLSFPRKRNPTYARA